MKNEARVLDMARHFHSQTDPRLHEERGPLAIVAGHGATIVDDAGNHYIEGMGGLWCASLGFSDSRLADAADRQMRKLAVYHTFNHRSNEPTIELVEQLAALAPFENARVFLAGSGSEANDTMVKLAWYYQAARGHPDKRKIISRFAAFHGSTVMGAALSGLPHMHKSFNLPPLPVIFAARPSRYFDSLPNETERDYATRLATELEALILEEGPDTIAAMIAEPVMGAGGVLVPPEDYFPKIQAILRKYNILMLSDEVVCGFGRTGNWFGSQTFGMEPDMLSIAKGMSSGHLPIGGVIISDKVYQCVADEAHKMRVFGHGFTYSGHPVTAAVAAEAIRIYREIDLVGRARRLGDYLHGVLAEAVGDHPIVGEIRGRGFIAGIQIVEDRAARRAFAAELNVGGDVERRCREHGVMIRNMGDVLAICPPYVITDREIDALVAGIRAALDGAAAANSGVGRLA